MSETHSLSEILLTIWGGGEVFEGSAEWTGPHLPNRVQNAFI